MGVAQGEELGEEKNRDRKTGEDGAGLTGFVQFEYYMTILVLSLSLLLVLGISIILTFSWLNAVVEERREDKRK